MNDLEQLLSKLIGQEDTPEVQIETLHPMGVDIIGQLSGSPAWDKQASNTTTPCPNCGYTSEQLFQSISDIDAITDRIMGGESK
jgi:hypothetical protein